MKYIVLLPLLAIGCTCGHAGSAPTQRQAAAIAIAWAAYGHHTDSAHVVYVEPDKLDPPGTFLSVDGRSRVYGETIGATSYVTAALPASTMAHELYHQYLTVIGKDPDPDHVRLEWSTLVSQTEIDACAALGVDLGCPTALGQY